jgi:hypothetical protein
MSNVIILALEQAAFALWRDKCRAELAPLGELKVVECKDGKACKA